MNGRPGSGILRLALLLLSTWAGPAAAGAVSTCAECHENLTDPKLHGPVRDLAASSHTSDAIGCSGCHKGDPMNPTVGAHDARKGFVAHPSGQIAVDVCGGCHADARFLLKFGVKLPTDQLALYGESPHGKLVRAGDRRGPTCATCHGTHDVAKPGAAASRVNPTRVADLCASCHADPSRMAPSTLPTDQYAKWSRSAHAEALRGGNLDAPACIGCHDAHLAVQPQVAAVAPACGRCHKEELATFEASSHSKPFARLGFDPCVPCHGNHDVARTNASMLGVSADAMCAKCHAADDKPRKAAEQLAAIVREAEGRATRARAALTGARSAGLAVADAGAILADLVAAERRLHARVHRVDPAALADEASSLQALADRAGAGVARATRARLIRHGGAWAAAAALVAMVGLWVVRRLRRRRA